LMPYIKTVRKEVDKAYKNTFGYLPQILEWTIHN
jgi:hypothetical protein